MHDDKTITVIRKCFLRLMRYYSPHFPQFFRILHQVQYFVMKILDVKFHESYLYHNQIKFIQAVIIYNVQLSCNFHND